MTQVVQYECKPVIRECKGIGHTTEDCRRKKYELDLGKMKPRQVWAPKSKLVPKRQNHEEAVVQEQVDSEKELVGGEKELVVVTLVE